MDDVRHWLESLGLDMYADVLAENDVDFRAIRVLTEDDLKELGLSLGHRRVFQQAIAELVDQPSLRANPVVQPESGFAEAERRQLTVMFADLVGSTELSQQLDPEALREVNLAYQDAAKGAIEQFGGYVARYMGDGVLAYFGYPQAHENDAERAVRAGLELTSSVPRLDTIVRLDARVGIATGGVVVGDLIGEGASQESAVVGETPNLAARLEGLSAPNAVTISATTRELVQGLFACQDLGEQRLKGFTEPQPAWSVTNDTAVESRFEALRARQLTPFIGRQSELGLLLDRWETAADGEGQVVLLQGEPGIGKSRLADELRRATNPPPHTLIQFQCSPHHGNSPFFPFISQLERTARFIAQDGADERLEKLEGVFGPSTPDRPRLLWLFATLLSLPVDRYPPLDLDPQALKAETIAAFCTRLSTLAHDGPMLLIFEDVHWIDPTSLEVLNALVEAGQRFPVLFVITHRPEFSWRWPAHGFVTELRLNRMARRDGLTIIRELAGESVLSSDVMQQILDKTDGVALFVEELTRVVVESGLGPDRAPLPTTLQGSLLSRIDRLGAQAKDVAQAAAVIGRDFRYGLLEALTEKPASVLTGALERLVEAGLVFRTDVSTNSAYAFKHALVQDAAYESLLLSRRKVLHGQIVTALEGGVDGARESVVELLAYHAQRGELYDKAIHYCRLAGEKANERSAYTEALGFLERALALIDATPDPATVSREKLNILLAMRPCLGALGDYDRMLGVLSDAADVARALGEDELALIATINRTHALYVHGQVETAVNEGHLALTAARKLDDRRLLISTNILLGIAHYFRGDLRLGLETALPYMDELRGMYRHSRLETTATSSVNWLCNLGGMHVLLGDFDAAMHAMEEANTIAEETGKPFDKAIAGWWYGHALATAGRPADAVERLESTLELTEAHRMTYLEQWARMALGSACVQLRQSERGQDLLRAVARDAAQLGITIASIWSRSELAHADNESGEFQAAIGHAQSSRIDAARGGIRWMEALATQRLARTYALLGEPANDRTEGNWLAALSLFKQCEAKPFIAHCERELGEFYDSVGKIDDARKTLSAALGAYRHLGVPSWIKSTEFLLSSAGTR